MALKTLFPKYLTEKNADEVIIEQRLLKVRSRLHFTPSKCLNCRICLDACPKQAITIPADPETVPLEFNPSVCSYCGVCTIVCPAHALEVEVNGNPSLPILEQEGFPVYDRESVIDAEKCRRCTTCRDACPNDAIKRDGPVFEGEKTGGVPRHKALTADVKFVICLHKCTVCGICAAVCPALSVSKRVFDSEKMSFNPVGCPAEKSGIPCNSNSGMIKWDKTKCDACGVCKEVCPQEAILEVTRILKKEPQLPGKVVIDQEKCIDCAWCKETCPEEAVSIRKPFEGTLSIDTAKCPENCTVCIDTCHCKALYLKDSGDGKKAVALNENLCILCGACVLACPTEKAMLIQRSAIHIKGEKTDLFRKIEGKLCEPKYSQGTAAESVEEAKPEEKAEPAEVKTVEEAKPEEKAEPAEVKTVEEAKPEKKAEPSEKKPVSKKAELKKNKKWNKK